MSSAMLLVIAAAGRGSRLAAGRPKPLVRVLGKPLVCHVLDSFAELVPDVTLVIQEPFQREFDEAVGHYRGRVEYEYQRDCLGTAHAVWQTFDRWAAYDAVIVAWADLVWPDSSHCKAIAEAFSARTPHVLVPSVSREHPYVGLHCEPDDRIVRAVERREGGSDSRLQQSDLGMFVIARSAFTEFERFMGDEQLGIGAHTGEKSFLPFLEYLYQRGQPALSMPLSGISTIAINTPEELASVTRNTEEI